MIDTKRWLESTLAHWLASAGTPCGVGLALTFTNLVFSSTAEATVRHVPGDFPTIQACIDAAATGDECVVAAGTYNELINFHGKGITLRSSDGPDATIIDAGPVPDPGTGKPVVRCDSGEGPDTVLEGFTLSGGTGGVCGTSGTSTCGGGMYNVGSSPTVNNCTFTANSAVGGGGMFNDGASPTVANCTFSGNTSLDGLGGGMGNLQNSNPTVSDCAFNSNVGGAGGGMGNNENSNPIVTHCAFNGNSGGRGGGMYNIIDSSPTVTNCTFTENTGVLGGGMWNAASSDPIVSDCNFSDNSGGGMINSGSSPTLTRCTFANNSGDGGLSNVVNSSPTVTNCAFTGNTTNGSGGGMSNSFDSNPIVTNCTFIANSAHGVIEAGGGGMANFGGSPTVTNCTFSGNTASLGDGGGIFSPFGNPTVTNCVFWGNRPNQIAGESSSLTVGYSNVQAGWPGVANIDADPLFTDPIGPDGIPGTGDEDVRLLPGSPCIDVGNNTAVPADTTDLDGDGDTAEPVPLDLDGHARFVDDPATPDCPLGGCGTPPLVDMGALELQQPCQTNADCDDGRPCTADACEAGRCVITPMPDCIRWYVDVDHCPEPGTGTPANPFCSIQAGIDVAVRGDTVLVAPGTYSELINFSGKAITLRGANGAAETVIDAEPLPIDPSGKTVVRCDTGEGPETLLDGFTLTGGSGTAVLGGSRRGGGMFNHGASPTVANCVFRGNSAFGNFGTGGGMYNEFGSSPTVTHCAFTENAAVFGGGMYSRVNSNPEVTHSVFSRNRAVETGGGMRNFDSANPTVINCVFNGNSADTGGGMANRENSNPAVTNCTFSGNTANFGGGMQTVDGSGPIVTGCTFSGNSAGIGGGILTTNEFGAPSTAALDNSIVWGNAPDQIADEFGGVTTVGDSDVQGGWPGAGNIDAEPLFVRHPSDGGDGWGDDPATPDVDEGANDDFGDLRLLFGSPCIDAGSNAALPPDTLDLDGDGDTLEAIPFDLDGHARVLCDVVDMGASESGIGDDDCDGDVDLPDYAAYFDCLTGPTGALPPGCAPFDFDGDGNVDLVDLAGLQRAFTGSP